MKKTQWIVLGVAMVLSLGLLFALYLTSPMSGEIYRASFNRRFMDTLLIMPGSAINIKFNSFYVAGYSDTMLYLGNSTAPFYLFKTNLAMTDTSHVIVRVSLDSIKNPAYTRISVVSPNFYVTNGIHPFILKGDIYNWAASPIMQDSDYFFTESVAFSPTGFALKSYSYQTKGYELAKKSISDFTFYNELLEKQVDGIFCVDGRLMFNKKLNKLVYLYFYRNEFIVSDTSFNINYRAHTIDTIRYAQVKVAILGDGKESMLGSPPAIINGLNCTDGDFLFIQSNLLAKNEDIDQFKSSSTIDCYNLASGEYLASFHVPNFQKERLSGFQIIDDKLFALFGSYLVQYHLNLP